MTMVRLPMRPRPMGAAGEAAAGPDPADPRSSVEDSGRKWRRAWPLATAVAVGAADLLVFWLPTKGASAVLVVALAIVGYLPLAGGPRPH